MKQVEAKHYDKLDDNRVRCHLCPAECLIRPSKHGICLIRTNENGTLYASEYGNTVALNIDPIEKKPLYHFKPGTDILSIGPNGCNFACVFCQNWSISQTKSESKYISPEDLLKLTQDSGSIGVAYTYTEPLIWFEYIYDSAKLLKEAGFSTVLVSNGYINEEPARVLFPYIDAMNIDLKSIRPDFYSKICKGKLDDVLRTIKLARELDVHLEITNLLITGSNDSDDDISDLVDWIYEFDPSVVLHLSRYFPNFKHDAPPTDPGKMETAYRIAKNKLKYVYTGNITGIGEQNTNCLSCGETLVKRDSYNIEVLGLAENKCRKCGTKTDIVI